MSRLNVLLAAIVMANALYLVRVQHHSRRVFVELDQALSESRRLALESQRLAVQVRALSRPLLVERRAIDQLHMHTPTPGITHYVRPGSSGVAP